MRFLILIAAIALSGEILAAPFTEKGVDSASLKLPDKNELLEFKVSETHETAVESSLSLSKSSVLAQRNFMDATISGYACNVLHTPSETNKWSIVLYNFSDPQDEGTVVFSTNKNRKIQSVACLPSGEQLIFSFQESTQGDTEIYVLDLEEGEVLRLTDNDTDDNDVSISQDGEVMAWQKRLADGRQAITIRTYRSQGDEFTEKSLASASPMVQPSLSANGEWLALVQLRPNNFLALRYDVANNTFKTVHSIPRRKRLFHPSVSADGNMFSWVENKAQSKFVVKNIQENTITKLVTGVSGIEHPYLSRTGESVMYSIGQQTLIKNISTGSVEEVAFGNRFLGSFWMGEPEAPELSGSWKLPGQSVILHFLPDGRYLAKQWRADYDFAGFEYGTYVANDGKITFNTLENHDGESLTCNVGRESLCNEEGDANPGVWGYTLTDSELSITPQGENETYVLERVELTESPVEGLWESLEAKEFVYFMGGDTYFYVDYFSEGSDDDIIFHLGKYTITSGDGESGEMRLDTTLTFSNDIYGPVCEQTGNTPCESASFDFSLVNGQLVIKDPENSQKAYFSQLLVNDDSPKNSGTLVAQKDYASDLEDSQNYGYEIEDDYRTRITTTEQSGTQANMVSVKLNIDEATTLVRNDSANLQARLMARYRDPDSELSIDVYVRIRRNADGSAAVGNYTIATCIDSSCDEEVYISRTVSGLGEFTGDHEMKIEWNDSTEEFMFSIDGAEIGRIAMSEYNADPRVIAAGGYTFNPADYVETRVYSDIYNIGVGESAYIAVHVDEVSINGDVYDDFENGLIDLDKWYYQSADR